MRYLILSDIHGNREALEAVLAHAQGYDQILCLGDLVGYGADPNFVVDWARANVAAIVRGNHDRIVSRRCFARCLPCRSARRAPCGLAALESPKTWTISRKCRADRSHARDSTWCTDRRIDEDQYLVSTNEARSCCRI